MPDERYLTTQEVTWLYGITKQGLQKWIEKGFPKKGRNQFPLKASLDWVRGNIWSTPDNDADMGAYKLREQKAKTEQRELIVQERMGELVRRDKVLSTYGALWSECRLAFRSQPRRLAGSLAALSDEREIESILRVENDKILKELARPIDEERRISRVRSKKRVGRKSRSAR